MGLPIVISDFHTFENKENEWAALSNFWQGEPMQFGAYTLSTAEHFFQALKARTRADAMKIISCATPAEARQAGKHMLRLRPDWEYVKYDAMRLVLAVKFCLGREEAAVLMRTGDALLVEGTTWGDQVWGVDLKEGRKRHMQGANAADGPALDPAWQGPRWEPGEGWQRAPGRNWLGALLMARRAELVAEQRGARFTYHSIRHFVRYQPVRRDG